jgi:hypothetical protein
MTAITHPLVSTHHVITVLLTAAVSVGVTVALMLAFTTTKSAVGHLTQADPVLCDRLANATPGSPAAFRLADTIASSGQSC